MIWLYAADLGVKDALLDGKPARVIASGDLVGLVADHELPPGPLAIDAKFTAAIDAERSRGMYSAPDGPDTYIYTFFEPTDARRAFPCFDEPNYKIPWTLVFHVRAGDVALGNAAIASEAPEASGMKRVELAPTRPLPSYLVAFMVGPFDVIPGGAMGRANTPLRFIVPKHHEAELGWAKQITPRVVAALEDYFDMPYPYGKLDVAVVPRYWGTMEHPGIVAMGQPLTLIAPDQDTRDREQHYTNILAHELSHYWFGDLVTMAWWDDTWLNESFGEWLDMIITNMVMPAWHYPETRVAIASGAMSSDEALSAQPIHRAVDARDGIQGSFDNESTYFKGSSAIRAVEAFVGPEKWRDFIRAYVRKHADGNEDEKSFMAEIHAALGAAAGDMFETYITRAGVPLVRVRAECAKGGKPRILIERSRSLPKGVADPDPKPWPIPVCLRYGDATHAQRECVTGDALEVAACPTWIEPNDDARGYYRSAIAPGLLDPRSPAKLSGAEKQMALADLRTSVARGELGIDELLGKLPALALDPDPLVAAAAIHRAGVAASALGDATYKAFRKWRHDAFAPLARKLGWHRAPGDSDEREQLREAALAAASFDDPALAREAGAVADAWLASHGKIDDGLLGVALHASAYRGDAARFERYLAAAKAATNVSDRQRLLLALGGFTNPELVKRADAIVLGKDFDLRDSLGILWSQTGPETLDAFFAFMTAHIDELLARMRDDEKSWLLAGLVQGFCDPQHRAAAEALAKPRIAAVEGAALAVTRGLERSQTCIDELARDRPAIEKFLHVK